MNENSAPRRTGKRALGVGCVIGVLLLAAPIVWVLIPDTASWRLAAANERAQLLRSELLQQDCERAALPGFSGDAPDLADVRISHPWLISPHGVRDALEGRAPGYGVSFTFRPAQAGTEPLNLTETPPPYNRPAPLYPPGLEPSELAEHRAHLGGLEEFLSVQMAKQSHCSPLIAAEFGNVPLSYLAQNIAIVARGKAQDGEFVRAIELLLYGAVLVRDFRLGPVELERAIDSAHAEAELYAHVQSLLYGPVEMPPDDIERLVSLTRILQAHPTPLHEHLRARLSVSSSRAHWSDTPPDQRAHQAGRVFDGLVDACEDTDATLSRCPMSLRIHEFRKWPDLGDLTAERNATLRADQDKMRQVADTLMVIAALPQLAHQMELLLTLVGERTHDRCPPDANIPEVRLMAPFAQAPTTIVERPGTPSVFWLQPPPESRDWSAVFLCPAGSTGPPPANPNQPVRVEGPFADVLTEGEISGSAAQVLANAAGVGVPTLADTEQSDPEPVQTDDGTRWQGLVIDGTLERDDLEPALQSALPTIRGCMAETPTPWSIDLELAMGMIWMANVQAATPTSAFPPLRGQRYLPPTDCVIAAIEDLPFLDFHGTRTIEAQVTLTRPAQ